MRLYIYEQTTSTNDLGKRSTFKEGDLIWAHEQSAGRGQRGNRWLGEYVSKRLRSEREGGENLTLSIVLEPTWLAASDQFFISQITALALIKTLKSYNIEAKIKWTNDIYIGDYKVAGVLIENNLSSGAVSRSVVGIGLNVNQQSFDASLPNPTSISLATGGSISREEVMQRLYDNLMLLYKGRDRDDVALEYNNNLYRANQIHTYRLANGTPFEATLIGVASRGELRLMCDDGKCREFLFKEVEFVIEQRNGVNTPTISR